MIKPAPKPAEVKRARNALHAQIQIARNQLGMVDDDYRALLERVTGQRSSSGLDDRQRNLVLVEMKRLGFKAVSRAAKRRASDKPYVRLIFAMWGELKRMGIWKEADAKSLRAFVKKMTNIDDPEFLSYGQATPVIEALKKMKERKS